MIGTRQRLMCCFCTHGCIMHASPLLAMVICQKNVLDSAIRNVLRNVVFCMLKLMLVQYVHPVWGNACRNRCSTRCFIAMLPLLQGSSLVFA